MKYFCESHEWIELSGDTATIGISTHAASELGDITYVELPDVGRVLTKGETFSVVESVKAASDIYSPASGTITAVNDTLDGSPETINEGAESSGWIIKLSGVKTSDLAGLMDEAAYKAFLAK